MTAPRKYGYLRGHVDKRDKVFRMSMRHGQLLPDVVDLRADPRMPPVWDQGSQGSCVGFGCAAVAAWKLRGNGLIIEPSQAFIYAEARMRRGWLATDSGAYVRDGVKVLAQQGVVSRAEFNYDDRVWDREPIDRIEERALENRVTGYARVPQDSYAIRAALADGHPIVFGFTVYEQFESVGPDGIVSMPIGAPLGGHCAVLAGYRTTQSVYDNPMVLVRNSWSEGWGQGGYCWMPFDYILDPELCADFTIVGLT